MNAPRAIPLVPPERGHLHDHPHGKRDTALWLGIIVSVAVHFLVFAFWPQMQAERMEVARNTLTAVDLPPAVEIPQAPPAIARPATPVPTPAADVREDITIAPTTFEANPVSELPPPPPPDEGAGGSLRDAPTFTPYTVRPRLLNRAEVQHILMLEYPPLLKEARIGGRAMVWFFIDEEGRVLETRLKESSGHEKLDEAALRVASAMRFSPAMNRDKRTKVWVQFPVIFQVR